VLFGRNKNVKKKILILGSTGLIGHQIYTHLNKFRNYELFNLSKSKLNNKTIVCDAVEYENLEKIITEIKPNFIINCIGKLIEDSELNPHNANELNGNLPHNLRKTSDKIHSMLIHLSTDCVFSGKKGYYNENDQKDGYGVYAKTKAKGEVISKDHLTIRTSIIGPELKKNGTELFDWFMRQEGSVNGFAKSIWSGTTTYELAKMIDFSIKQNIKYLYNFTSLHQINKFELLCLLKKIFKKKIIVNKVDGIETNKVLIDNRKLITFKRYEYETLIKKMYINIKKNSDQYKEYKKYIY
jgi:dTDP-4-dehydrorhamnose reductase